MEVCDLRCVHEKLCEMEREPFSSVVTSKKSSRRLLVIVHIISFGNVLLVPYH